LVLVGAPLLVLVLVGALLLALVFLRVRRGILGWVDVAWFGVVLDGCCSDVSIGFERRLKQCR
jgi:hypothetical protein